MERIGPYRVSGVLGGGGMGVVYRAESPDGMPVALKTLRGVKARDAAALHREIRSLARLRHPGIVRILGSGVAGGAPWYAMELVEGHTLRGRVTGSTEPMRVAGTWSLDDLDTFELPPEGEAPSLDPVAARDALEQVHAICEPLAFLHGEGLVHRDLKPDNVMIRPDGSPVLVDFGLLLRVSGQASREDLDAVESLGGTPAYVAPEVVRGDVVDARADLYSLGCVLFELLTGAPPFQGSPSALWAQHASATPPRLADRLAGVAPELDELVAELLAKDPNDRPGFADEVAARLVALGSRRPLAPPSRRHLYRPRLVGREAEASAASQALDRVAEGASALIVGGPGSGRTRLLTEVALEARRRGLRALVSTCPGPERPFGGLVGPVTELLAAAREAGDPTALGRAAPLAPVMSGVPADPGAPAEPGASRARMVAAALDLLEAAAAERPLLLAVDDAHRADPLVSAVLGSLVRRPRRGVSLVLTALADAPTPELAGAPRIPLGPLNGASVGRLVGDMLGTRNPPHGLVAALVDKAEGSPLGACEYLRAAVDAGWVQRDGGTWRTTGQELALALPATLRELAAQRLAALSEPARRLAEAGAVQGRGFDVGVASAASGGAAEHVRELVARGLAEPRDGDARFATELIAEVVREGVPRERAAALHRATAAALGPTADVVERVRHLAEGGARDEALGLALEAADRCVERLDLAGAARWMRFWLDAPGPPTPERVAVRNRMAATVIGNLPGSGDLAFAEHERALAEAEAIGDARGQAQSLVDLAVLEREGGALDAARARLERARRLAPDAASELPVDLELGTIELDAGQLAASEARLTGVARRAEELGLHKIAGVAWANVGVGRSRGGHPAEAVAFLARAAELLVRDPGAAATRATLIHVQLTIQIQLGRGVEIADELARNVERCRRAGLRRVYLSGLTGLASVREGHGDPAGARALYEEALAGAIEEGWHRDASQMGWALAALDAQAGDLAAARARIPGMRAAAERSGGLRVLGQVDILEARLARLAGDPERAAALVELAARRGEEAGDDDTLAMVSCERALLAQVVGEPTEALVAEARRRVAAADPGPGSDVGWFWREVEGLGSR